MRRVLLLVALAAAIVTLTSPVAQATPPQAVTISVNRGPAGDLWSSSGAFTDSGTLADRPTPPGLTRPGTYHVVRTWTGSDGTWNAHADVKIIATHQPGVFDVIGSWAVTAGTGVYATLHGTGSLDEVFDANAGTVVGTWEGSVHFD
jgi:hypothetical protein